MDIKEILNQVKNDEKSVEEALKDLSNLPFEDLDFAKVDHHRTLRNGYPEVIYGEGKTKEHIRKISISMNEKKSNILITRTNKEVYEYIKDINENIEYEESCNLIKIYNKKVDINKKGSIVVVTGGTSDINVADEAYYTAKFFGNDVKRVYDVGVAGIHRLFNYIDILREARVIITVAGMEGALTSVVGGLVDVPVIGVPTSVGYGANFNGVSALLCMINSCASGISVVNIDNGFGAGYLASMMNKL